MEDLVWKYDIRKPKAFLRENPEVWNLLRLAQEYRRGLVDLAIDRKKVFDDIRREVSPDIVELEELEADLLEEYNELKREFSGVKRRSRDESPEADRAKNLKGRLRDVRTRLADAKRPVNDLLAPWNEARKRICKELKSGLKKGDSHGAAAANAEADAAMAANAEVPEFWKRVHANDVLHNEKRKELGAKFKSRGLPDQHRELVREAVEQALKKLRGRPIRHKYIEGGLLGYRRKSSGISVAELLSGADPWISLEALPADQWSDTPLHSARQGAKFARPKFRLKLRANPELTVSGTIAMDRPLPNGASIKSVRLSVKKLGNRWRCSLLFQISTSKRKRPVGRGVVAVNVGWRVRPGALRAAGPNADVERDWGENGRTRVMVAVDESGNETEYCLPAKLREREAMIRRIQSVSDSLFNDATKVFVGFCKNRPELHEDVSVVRYIKGERTTVRFLDEIARASCWRAHWKLWRVVREMSWSVLQERLSVPIEQLWGDWKVHRHGGAKPRRWRGGGFAGEQRSDLFVAEKELAAWAKSRGITDPDNHVMLWLEWWRRKDQHLVQVHRAMTHRNSVKTKHFYREAAAQLAARYETIRLGKQQFAKQKRRPSVENDIRTEQEIKAASNMHKASPGLCHATLKERFKGRVELVDMVDVTRIHQGCGCELIGDRKSDLMLRCAVSGEMVDQDTNAAKNILEGGIPMNASGSYPEAAE